MLTLAVASRAESRTLKIATWNLDWLTLRADDDRRLPLRRPHRKAPDWRVLARYVHQLDADIVALQEVDGVAPVRRLFNDPRDTIIISHAAIVQNVAVVLRAPLKALNVEELNRFDVPRFQKTHALRPGLDVLVKDGATTLHILAVHLKSGCWDRTYQDTKHSCPALREQLNLIADWIAEREDEEEAFVILGDFNRQLTVHDPYFQKLSDPAAVRLTTSGFSNPCGGGTYFIDHILLGGSARGWFEPNSLRVMTWKDRDSSYTLSDHCPVSIRLTLPPRPTLWRH